MPRDLTDTDHIAGERGDEHDFTVEPIPGLPGSVPRGEYVLWQGRPRALALAVDSLWLRWVAAYFVLLAGWRVLASAEGGTLASLPLAIPFLLLGLAACALLYAIAWAQARATIYTITTERVAMRIGAALTLTVNLPLPKIAAADLAAGPLGTGSIALTPVGHARLSYLVLWPHIRPWRMKHPAPTLRAVPGAPEVARILADAVAAKEGRVAIAEPGARPDAAADHRGAGAARPIPHPIAAE